MKIKFKKLKLLIFYYIYKIKFKIKYIKNLKIIKKIKFRFSKLYKNSIKNLKTRLKIINML